MKKRLMGLVATLALASPMLANAVPTTWTVTLEDTRENVYVGSLVVDSSYLLPNTTIASSNWISFAITVRGVLFDLPTVQATDGVRTNSQGALSLFADSSPSYFYTEFCAPTNSNCNALLSFREGTNTWEFASYNGSARGTYSITGAVTAVPEPATLGLLGLALAGVGVARRRRSA